MKSKTIDLGSYGAIPADDAKTFIANKSKIVIDYGVESFENLKKYAEDGKWTWRIAGFIAGLSIIALSLLSLLSDFFGLQWFSVLADIYLLAFGIISCVLEYKEKVLTNKYLNVLRKEALFLSRPYGRAIFYMLIGTLLIARGSILSFLVGLYISAVGAVLFYSSYTAISAFQSFRDARFDTGRVSQKFKEYDRDGNGSLDSSELAALVASLGTTLSLNELESALLLIDKNDDGKITFEEFLSWYQGKEDVGIDLQV